eukprot:scaffold221798_cov32-Tisochrysis_lutea.AAC.1
MVQFALLLPPVARSRSTPRNLNLRSHHAEAVQGREHIERLARPYGIVHGDGLAVNIEEELAGGASALAAIGAYDSRPTNTSPRINKRGPISG